MEFTTLCRHYYYYVLTSYFNITSSNIIKMKSSTYDQNPFMREFFITETSRQFRNISFTDGKIIKDIPMRELLPVSNEILQIDKISYETEYSISMNGIATAATEATRSLFGSAKIRVEMVRSTTKNPDIFANLNKHIPLTL